jgi:fructose 1,6-bisphosphatase
MRLTLSLIKADVGSVGRHTQPTELMLDAMCEAADATVAAGYRSGGGLRP